jgi:hypothetical protein
MSNEVYDAILDRPEPQGSLSELEMRVEWLERRILTIERFLEGGVAP